MTKIHSLRQKKLAETKNEHMEIYKPEQQN